MVDYSDTCVWHELLACPVHLAIAGRPSWSIMTSSSSTKWLTSIKLLSNHLVHISWRVSLFIYLVLYIFNFVHLHSYLEKIDHYMTISFKLPGNHGMIYFCKLSPPFIYDIISDKLLKKNYISSKLCLFCIYEIILRQIAEKSDISSSVLYSKAARELIGIIVTPKLSCNTDKHLNQGILW